ncbi:hexosaminidase [Pustulibacterium marinum]|uniref:beta-N-acetylhexosaminidase n=1 Tax=Pustulibacterium marinum TaxID=1224947 RepID=A0A1I7G515_9FLAO|nr:glycoside hydrolase family 20 protein [Pustulibacterium marinum]SFU43316.1 hexosaminidase [Pustulibacterium marinum]
MLNSKFNFSSIAKVALGITLFGAFAACKQEAQLDAKQLTFTVQDINIVPKPNAVKLNEGAFLFTDKTQVYIAEKEWLPLAEILQQPFHSAAGITINTASSLSEENYISIKKDTSLAPEHYELQVTSNHINIKASDYNGALYGLESILQLLPPQIESTSVVSKVTWAIPNVQITDGPRFSWRGVMLDVSRHFFKKEYVKEVIDELAFHKMNTLHLHLVDDQGWRIEIKKYPKLTEVGAFRVDQEGVNWRSRRTPELGEKATYGGYYTQEDLKEIVAYAQKKGIEVIPEIEMPAHVMSAIAAYPELSCTGEPIMVPSGSIWPITDIYCAGKDSTFEFLEDVLDEVMTIFPSKYIHVGGDEATKTEWKKCPHCQERIKTEKLSDVDELQSYFMKRIEKYIVSKNKQMIGWDEILEGGLAPEATVMSWRGFKGGWEASEQGHDVIMTPVSHCYFDYYQGPQDSEPEAFNAYTPLSQVYTFDPVVDSMSTEQASHILGGQANLWSEYIPTTTHSEYMLYPRLSAMSEALWSEKEQKNWPDFSRRVQVQMQRYAFGDINYAKSAYSIMANDSAAIAQKAIVVKLTTEFPNADIRYTLDGSEVDKAAKKYTDSIMITKSGTLKAAVFKDGEPYGAEFKKHYQLHKALGKNITFTKQPYRAYRGSGPFTLVNGLGGSLDFHDGKWQAWLDSDMEAIIDLGEQTLIHNVQVSALESQGSGINFPTAVTVWVSKDGKHFTDETQLKRPFTKNANRSKYVFDLELKKQEVQYLKIVANNYKTGLGGGSFIFLDEIVVE